MPFSERRKSETPWWREDKEELHGCVWSQGKALCDSQDYLYAAHMDQVKLYSSRALASLLGGGVSQSVSSGQRIRINVIKSCGDAAVAHMGTSHTKPMFLTEKGDVKLRRRAKNLAKFISGIFYEVRFYIESLKVFLLAYINGTSHMYVGEEDGRIVVEPVPDWNVTFDEAECEGGPRTLWRIKNMPRWEAKEKYPDWEEELDSAVLFRDSDFVDDNNSDLISRMECWHLPPDRETEGRYFMGFSSCTIKDEPFNETTFPLVTFVWSELPGSVRGMGGAEELAPIQMEIGYLAQKLQRLANTATGRVWVQKGSDVGKLDNKEWAIGFFSGRPPVVQNATIAGPEWFRHLSWLIDLAYRIIGITQLQAQGVKPGGLDSGEALQNFHDISSKRFQHIGQRWEQFTLDVAEQIILKCAQLQEAKVDMSAIIQDNKDIQTLNFSEVSIPKSKYVMKAFPAALMPDTPAGKIEQIMRLGQSNPQLQPYLLRLLTDIPDLESITSILNAPQELSEMMVEMVLETGELVEPYPGMDLEYTRVYATKALLKGYLDNIPDGRLDRLRDFIDAVDDLIERSKPPVPPMAPGGLQPPPGGPGEPPQLPGPLPGGPLPVPS